MEQFAEQLKGNGIDLAWWPLFLRSYQEEVKEKWAASRAEGKPATETLDFEESLP